MAVVTKTSLVLTTFESENVFVECNDQGDAISCYCEVDSSTTDLIATKATTIESDPALAGCECSFDTPTAVTLSDDVKLRAIAICVQCPLT